MLFALSALQNLSGGAELPLLLGIAMAESGTASEGLQGVDGASGGSAWLQMHLPVPTFCLCKDNGDLHPAQGSVCLSSLPCLSGTEREITTLNTNTGISGRKA